MKKKNIKTSQSIAFLSLLLVIFVFGCYKNDVKNDNPKSTFYPDIAQKQLKSKSIENKWEYVLDIVSKTYVNRSEVDQWLVEIAPTLFSNKGKVPQDVLVKINYKLYNAKVTKSAFLFAEYTFLNNNIPQFGNGYAAATLSNYYQDLKLFDSVKKYNLILKNSLPFFESGRLKVIYFTNHANSLKEQGKLFESAVNYHKALSLIDANDSITKFTLITNLSSIYHELNYPDKAKLYIDSARHFIPLKEWSNEALNLAGLIFSKTGDFHTAQNYFTKAITKAKSSNNPMNLAQCYSNFANFNRRIKRYDSALNYMRKSDSICRELQVNYGLLINRINRSELYLAKKEYTIALQEISLVKPDLLIYDIPSLQMNYFDLSFRIYDALGEKELANSMFREYTERKEAFFGDLPRSILAEWELSTENEKITEDRARYNLQKEQQSKEKFIFLFGGLLLIVLFVLFYLARNRRYILEREKTNKDRQRIAFELELKSKQLVSESLKNLTIQNTKDELMTQLEVIIRDIPKMHHSKFDMLKGQLKLHPSTTILNEFETRFTGVYEQYYENLKKFAPDLTPNELRICAFMRLNISTKEIALLTNRTIGTVDNIRSSVRKKLKLDEETNLQEYLLSI